MAMVGEPNRVRLREICGKAAPKPAATVKERPILASQRLNPLKFRA
jgi:hypothetical protein